MICDFAEYYHIYNLKECSPRYASILACGLRGDSRIFGEISGTKHSLETMLLASMTDKLSWLVWAKTKDAERGKNKPKSIYEALNGEFENEITSFKSGNDFERARERLLKG